MGRLGDWLDCGLDEALDREFEDNGLFRDGKLEDAAGGGGKEKGLG